MRTLFNKIAMIAALLFTLIATHTAYAQPSPHPLPQYEHQQRAVFSEVLNETRTVTVRLPESYYSDKERVYPVIYRLDGAEYIPLLSAVLESLHRAGSAPEVIIVAIENTDRLRDMFPTVNKDPRGPVGIGGGSDAFLKFIETELIPMIDSQYRTHDFRVIAGGSAAGVFALYAMEQRPSLFQATIAYSPAVWGNYGAAAKRTKAFFTKTQTFDHYLYMDMGAESGFMRAVYDEMQGFMQDNTPDGLTLKIDAFDGVPHGLTSSAGIFNAYHGLFLPLNIPQSAFKGHSHSIEQYYEKLSKQRGEKITPPEAAVRYLGYGLVERKSLKLAIKIFRYNTQLHPRSPEAHNALAYGYEQDGQLKQSLVQVKRALALSKPGDAGYDVFAQRRDRLSAKLN